MPTYLFLKKNRYKVLNRILKMNNVYLWGTIPVKSTNYRISIELFAQKYDF